MSNNFFQDFKAYSKNYKKSRYKDYLHINLFLLFSDPNPTNIIRFFFGSLYNDVIVFFNLFISL